MRRRRKRVHDQDDGDDIVEDQGHVHVRMDMMDGGQRSVHDHFRRVAASDATVGHKPGYVQDALRFQTTDARLADAIAEREQAFRDLERRSQNSWRKKFADAKQRTEPLGAEGGAGAEETGEPDEDDDETSLEQAMQDREHAYEEAKARSESAWRMRSAPANGVLAREKAWRHGA